MDSAIFDKTKRRVKMLIKFFLSTNKWEIRDTNESAAGIRV